MPGKWLVARRRARRLEKTRIVRTPDLTARANRSLRGLRWLEHGQDVRDRRVQGRQ
jgi:hypothetical protein